LLKELVFNVEEINYIINNHDLKIGVLKSIYLYQTISKEISEMTSKFRLCPANYMQMDLRFSCSTYYRSTSPVETVTTSTLSQ
jgi:hypothetical protein